MVQGAIVAVLMTSAAWSACAGAQQVPAPPTPLPSASDPGQAAPSTSTAPVPDQAEPPADPQLGEQAQSAAGAPGSGDIIVTALKQGQTVLQAPASITVLEPATLAAKNITVANQLNGIVPGLTMAVGVGGLPGTSFRGLGSNSAVFNVEPSVAEYIDGVYMPHARDYVAPLYDLDHIEFIRGTQSTLLGKNTSLGAISLVNQRPGAAPSFLLRYNHGFTIGGNRVEGVANVPLTDTLRVRAAFLASSEGGYIYNRYERRTEPRDEELSGRISVAWDASDRFNVFGSYQRDHRSLRGQLLEVVSDPNRTIANRAAATGVPLDTLATGISVNASAPLGGTTRGINPFDRQDTDRLNLIANYTLGNHVLTSQTSYGTWFSPRLTDLDFTAANLFNIVDRERSKTFTQEVRLASPRDGRLTYLLGAFYFYNKWSYGRVFGGSNANTVGFPLTGLATSQTELPTRAASAFASGTFELVPGLKVDAGVRYTHEKKRGTFVRNTTGTLAGGFPTVPFTTYTPKVTNPVDYNAGLRFEPTSTVLLYGSYSKGSKSGGFQDAPTTPAGAPFASETAKSIEVGAKLRLPRGFLTGALYRTDVDGFQTNFTLAVGAPPVSQTVVGNSNVRSQGFELSGAQDLFDGLKLSANVVYADAKLRDPFPANGSLARAGDRLTRAPKWSAAGDLSYDHAVTSRLNLFAGVDVSYTSLTRYQFVVAQPLAPVGVKHTLVGARLGLREERSGLEVAVLGTNLTDKRYITFDTAVTAGNGAYYGSFNRPRVIALQVTLKR